MSGGIDLDIALATYTNDYLYGSREVKLTADHPVMKYISTLAFADRLYNSKGIKFIPYEEWVSTLKAAGVKRLRMIFGIWGDSDVWTQAFVGGGAARSLEAQKGDKSDFYIAKWEFLQEKSSWIVKYYMSGQDSKMVWGKDYGGRSIEEMNRILRGALEEGIDFVESLETQGIGALDWCKELFRKSVLCLRSDEMMKDPPPYYRELAPDGFLSLEAAQILQCCQVSFVFGGMGTWNDVPFGNDIRYREVTEHLYNAIISGFTCAVNSR